MGKKQLLPNDKTIPFHRRLNKYDMTDSFYN